MKHIHTLTGLRGIAVLVVFVSHAANGALLPKVFGSGFGQIGVMLFFVLSGFLMTHLYVKRQFSAEQVARYALARIGRVFPLYLFVLCFSLIVSNTFFKSFYYGLSDPATILLSFSFVTAPYILWTIPVEVQFYCVFVGFWYLFSKNAGAPVLIGFVCLMFAPALWLDLASHKPLNVLPTYVLSFFLGAGTAFIYDRVRSDSKVRHIANLAGLPLLVLLFVNLPALRSELGLVYSNWFFLRTWGDPLNWMIVYGLFFCAMLNSSSLSFLNWKPFVFLGEVSYGFYLIHMPVLMHLGLLNLDPLVWLVSALLLSAMLSYLSFRYFERPVGRYIRGLENFRLKRNL